MPLLQITGCAPELTQTHESNDVASFPVGFWPQEIAPPDTDGDVTIAVNVRDQLPESVDWIARYVELLGHQVTRPHAQGGDAHPLGPWHRAITRVSANALDYSSKRATTTADDENSGLVTVAQKRFSDACRFGVVIHNHFGDRVVPERVQHQLPHGRK
jgi:hypothetical protein